MESPYVSFCVPPAGSSSSLESSQVIMALALHLAARRSCLCSLSAVQPPPHGKICAIYRVFSLESCCAMWCCFLFRKTFISSYLCNPISFLSNLMILLSLLSIFRFFKNLRWNSGKETFVDVMVLLMNLVFSFLFFFFLSFQVHLTAAKPVTPHWRHGVLTTGPVGKSLSLVCLKLFMTEDVLKYHHCTAYRESYQTLTLLVTPVDHKVVSRRLHVSPLPFPRARLPHSTPGVTAVHRLCSAQSHGGISWGSDLHSSLLSFSSF